jgi:hypothetical protein
MIVQNKLEKVEDAAGVHFKALSSNLPGTARGKM